MDNNIKIEFGATGGTVVVRYNLDCAQLSLVKEDGCSWVQTAISRINKTITFNAGSSDEERSCSISVMLGSKNCGNILVEQKANECSNVVHVDTNDIPYNGETTEPILTFENLSGGKITVTSSTLNLRVTTDAAYLDSSITPNTTSSPIPFKVTLLYAGTKCRDYTIWQGVNTMTSCDYIETMTFDYNNTDSPIPTTGLTRGTVIGHYTLNGGSDSLLTFTVSPSNSFSVEKSNGEIKLGSDISSIKNTSNSRNFSLRYYYNNTYCGEQTIKQSANICQYVKYVNFNTIPQAGVHDGDVIGSYALWEGGDTNKLSLSFESSTLPTDCLSINRNGEIIIKCPIGENTQDDPKEYTVIVKYDGGECERTTATQDGKVPQHDYCNCFSFTSLLSYIPSTGLTSQDILGTCTVGGDDCTSLSNIAFKLVNKNSTSESYIMTRGSDNSLRVNGLGETSSDKTFNIIATYGSKNEQCKFGEIDQLVNTPCECMKVKLLPVNIDANGMAVNTTVATYSMCCDLNINDFSFKFVNISDATETYSCSLKSNGTIELSKAIPSNDGDSDKTFKFVTTYSKDGNTFECNPKTIVQPSGGGGGGGSCGDFHPQVIYADNACATFSPTVTYNPSNALNTRGLRLTTVPNHCVSIEVYLDKVYSNGDLISNGVYAPNEEFQENGLLPTEIKSSDAIFAYKCLMDTPLYMTLDEHDLTFEVVSSDGTYIYGNAISTHNYSVDGDSINEYALEVGYALDGDRIQCKRYMFNQYPSLCNGEDTPSIHYMNASPNLNIITVESDKYIMVNGKIENGTTLFAYNADFRYNVSGTLNLVSMNDNGEWIVDENYKYVLQSDGTVNNGYKEIKLGGRITNDGSIENASIPTNTRNDYKHYQVTIYYEINNDLVECIKDIIYKQGKQNNR
jgi:hypothetical protein